jgi:beta-1,4-mannosyltransferase
MEQIKAYLPVLTSKSYTTMLSNSLRREGVAVFELPLPLTVDWLIAHQGPGSALHHHWPSFHYTMQNRAQMDSLVALWIDQLELATKLGFATVGTVHNLYPHVCVHKDLQHRARASLIKQSGALIVHCNYAARCVSKTFGISAAQIATIPHGNYTDYYGPAIPQARARRLLRLPETGFLYMYFGLIKEYKGLEFLLDSFRASAELNATLLIVGRAESAGEAERIAKLTQGDPRILFRPGFVPDPLVPAYFGGADVVVLPYSNVLTSGTVALAHSLGRPVIAPAIGCIPEMVPEGTGLLYDPTDPSALRQCFDQILDWDSDEATRMCLQWASSLTWDRIAALTRLEYIRALDEVRSSVVMTRE